MTIAVEAVYENGVLKPDRPLELEEKAKVYLIIEVKAEAASPAGDQDVEGWSAIDRLLGIGKAVTPDGAERHDAYLYGDPED